MTGNPHEEAKQEAEQQLSDRLSEIQRLRHRQTARLPGTLGPDAFLDPAVAERAFGKVLGQLQRPDSRTFWAAGGAEALHLVQSRVAGRVGGAPVRQDPNVFAYLAARTPACPQLRVFARPYAAIELPAGAVLDALATIWSVVRFDLFVATVDGADGFALEWNAYEDAEVYELAAWGAFDPQRPAG